MNYYSLFLLFFLSACGFSPMLSNNDSVNSISEEGARLLVTSKSNANSYVVHHLKQKLKRTLINTGLSKEYKILVTVDEDSGSIAYAADATCSRSVNKLSAELIINKNSQPVFETKLNALTSFSQNANDEFMNQSAQSGAKERLIESLNIDISREVFKFAKKENNS